MEFLKCRDVRLKGPGKRNKPDVVATTAKHPDSRSQISRYGWMQPTYMRSVSFWGKFTSGSRISDNRSDLLKLPNVHVDVKTDESHSARSCSFNSLSRYFSSPIRVKRFFWLLPPCRCRGKRTGPLLFFRRHSNQVGSSSECIA